MTIKTTADKPYRDGVKHYNVSLINGKLKFKFVCFIPF